MAGMIGSRPAWTRRRLSASRSWSLAFGPDEETPVGLGMPRVNLQEHGRGLEVRAVRQTLGAGRLAGLGARNSRGEGRPEPG